MDLRTGVGIDFHRLIKSTKRPLFLGGVELAEDVALLGHSDADIVLHAVSDAILGALGKADIGEFFPNQDPMNKDLDSKKIIALTVEELQKAGFQISNLDISIIGEKPKISPHRHKICQSLAILLTSVIVSSETENSENREESKSRIAVKATSTEKMGALGREEGLACIANVLLIKK